MDGSVSFVPTWVVEDLLIYIATAIMIVYIVTREPRPIPRLMELFAFTLLYGSVYENLATLKPLYGYGPSLIMILNTPLSIPLFEFMVMYSALRLTEAMRIPTWCKPLVAGFLAVVADFAMDPLAVKQVFHTQLGTMGRWFWFTNRHQVMIYGEPVANFTGWMLIIGLGATFFLLGRWWHQKARYSTAVGYIYPILSSLAALLVLVSPVSSFVEHAAPFFAEGSNGEWVMLIASLVIPAALLAVFWRGRMLAALPLREHWPVYVALAGFPVIDVIFCLIGAHWNILWLIVVATAAMLAVVGGIHAAGRRQAHTAPR